MRGLKQVSVTMSHEHVRQGSHRRLVATPSDLVSGGSARLALRLLRQVEVIHRPAAISVVVAPVLELVAEALLSEAVVLVVLREDLARRQLLLLPALVLPRLRLALLRCLESGAAYTEFG